MLEYIIPLMLLIVIVIAVTRVGRGAGGEEGTDEPAIKQLLTTIEKSLCSDLNLEHDIIVHCGHECRLECPLIYRFPPLPPSASSVKFVLERGGLGAFEGYQGPGAGRIDLEGTLSSLEPQGSSLVLKLVDVNAEHKYMAAMSPIRRHYDQFVIEIRGMDESVLKELEKAIKEDAEVRVKDRVSIRIYGVDCDHGGLRYAISIRKIGISDEGGVVFGRKVVFYHPSLSHSDEKLRELVKRLFPEGSGCFEIRHPALIIIDKGKLDAYNQYRLQYNSVDDVAKVVEYLMNIADEVGETRLSLIPLGVKTSDRFAEFIGNLVNVPNYGIVLREPEQVWFCENRRKEYQLIIDFLDLLKKSIEESNIIQLGSKRDIIVGKIEQCMEAAIISGQTLKKYLKELADQLKIARVGQSYP